MILLTWRLMPAYVHLLWNRETWESQIYFTNHTLSRRARALDAASRHYCQRVPRNIYFTNRTLSDKGVPWLLTLGAVLCCQWSLAVLTFISPIAL